MPEFSISELLARNKAKVLDEFSYSVRAAIPSIAMLGENELIDSMPRFIDILIDTLAVGENRTNVNDSTDIGAEHGKVRGLIPDFSLRDLLIEYRILSRLIFDKLRQDRSLDVQHEDIIHDAIHRGIASSANGFLHVRSESEQKFREERESLLEELKSSRKLLEASVEELRNSQQELHDFFMQAPVGLAILGGPEHKYTFVNPRFVQISGQDPTGLRVAEAFKEEEACHYIRVLDGVFKTAVPYIGKEIPFPKRGNDGSYTELFINVDFHPFRAADGTVRGVIEFVRDVTEEVRIRKAIEQQRSALMLSEGRLKIALEAAQMGTWRLDLQSGLINQDENFNRILGLEAKATVHPHFDFSERVHPDDRPVVKEALDLATRDGNQFNAEYRVVRPDGSKRWLRSQGRKIVHGEEIPDYLTGAVLDITRQKEAEEALQRTHSQLQKIADSVPIHLIHLDREERFLFVNQALLNWCGKSRSEVLGKTLKEFFVTAKYLEVQKYVEQVFNFGKTISHETRFTSHDGKVHYFLCTYAPDMSSEGKVRGVIATATDIQQTRSMIQQLEQEREIRERFVAMLSHDLRTPLTAAKMNAQLLVRRLGDPIIVQKAVGGIISNLDRSDHMIRDLLDANRLSAGERLPLLASNSDLRDIILQTVDELIAIHGSQFETIIPGPVYGYWSVEGIRRILENLCNNAIKYGARNQKVTIRLNSISRDQAEISVHNWGTPISPKEQEKLFEKYHRSMSAQSGHHKGWGLGLALVKGLAEAHDGIVEVVSSLDQGTTFKVTLRSLQERSQEAG